MSIISGFLRWKRIIFYKKKHVLLSQWCQDMSVEFKNGYLLNQLIGNNPLPFSTVSESMTRLKAKYKIRCEEILDQILSEESYYTYNKTAPLPSLIDKVHVIKKEGYDSNSDLMNVDYSEKKKNVLVSNSSFGDNIVTVVNINGIDDYAGKKGIYNSDRDKGCYSKAVFPYKFKIKKISGDIDSRAVINFEFKSNCSVYVNSSFSNVYLKKSINLKDINIGEYIDIVTTNNVIYNFIKISIDEQSNNLILDIEFSWDGFEIVTPKMTIK